MPALSPGFTLIELLVVVAIISLLVSILLPSLARAKELARAIVCLTNGRQQAMAAYQYCEDNGGTFPRHNTWWSNHPVYYYLSGYIAEPGPDVANPTGPWICPSDPCPRNYPLRYPNGGDSATYYSFTYGKRVYTSYAYNVANNCGNLPYDPYGLCAYGNGPDGNNKDKVRGLSEIRTPSRTLMFVCGSATRALTYWVPITPPMARYLDPVHVRGSTVLGQLVAVDGHSEAAEASDVDELPEYWYRIDE
jgi:prepilin-type N-terminal cleavage/methylation domain-containing protein